MSTILRKIGNNHVIILGKSIGAETSAVFLLSYHKTSVMGLCLNRPLYGTSKRFGSSVTLTSLGKTITPVILDQQQLFDRKGFGKSLTYLSKPLKINQVHIRTMLLSKGLVKKKVTGSDFTTMLSTKTPLTKTAPKVLSEKTYATGAGKVKLNKEHLTLFSKETQKNQINKHAQCITDFDLIYDDPKQIRVFNIGSLYTKARKNSYPLSKEQNYNQEASSQQIEFFFKPLLITDNLHIIKKSRKYFDNSIINDLLKKSPEYKRLYKQVLEELKDAGIKVRPATTIEDYHVTGLSILYQTMPVTTADNFLEKIIIKKD